MEGAEASIVASRPLELDMLTDNCNDVCACPDLLYNIGPTKCAQQSHCPSRRRQPSRVNEFNTTVIFPLIRAVTCCVLKRLNPSMGNKVADV